MAVNQALADASSSERIDHRTLKAQGVPREPLPHMPHPIVTGRIRQLAGELAGRVNQWQAARFRKLAMQILENLRGGKMVSCGIMAALEEEAATDAGLQRRGEHAPHR